MAIEKTDTLVIGAGQAGVATSEHLSKLDIPHIVLEKDRIAERWRTARWDSLVANGPAWHDRFPGLEFENDPEEFVGKDQVADYFEAYAIKHNAPIRTGVEVLSVERFTNQSGFKVVTSQGEIHAQRVVSATGPFQKPVIPAIVANTDHITQMHSTDYRNPEQLADGAVLVVGAGSSGVQIADELRASGKKVYLSVCAHGRPPRSYRNRDFVWWLGVLGEWEAAAMKPGTEHVTIAVSGANGGKTINFRELANKGMTLVGRTAKFDNGTLYFDNDLVENLNKGDQNYLSVLDAADAYIESNGLDLPEEPSARETFADAQCISNPIRELNIADAGISTIIWATGFALDYSWLKVDALDEQGKPKHQRGVSAEAGFYFVGLPWLSRRGSSFIWGVWHDAKYIADHISIQRHYLSYQDASQR